MRVDFPAPFSPRIAWIVPGLHAKSTFSSARIPAKYFEIPRYSTIGSVNGSPPAGDRLQEFAESGDGGPGRCLPGPERAQRYFTSASDCDMIAGPETLTPQGGNSFTVKKLSGRSDQ